MAEEVEWKSYIQASFTYIKTDGSISDEVVIEPMQRMRRRGTKPKTVIDSTNQANSGVIHKFPRYTWELTMISVSEALPILEYCKEHNLRMTVRIEEVLETDNLIGMGQKSWTLSSIDYEGAWVDDISEVFVVNDAPVVTVSGMALRINSDEIDKVG